MANLRELKKQIRYICSDIASECLIAGEYLDGADKKALKEIVVKLAQLQHNALANLSFKFDKVPSDFPNKHEYNKAKEAYDKKAFAAFREKFNSRVQEIVKEMNAAVPQAARQAAKK